MALPRPAGLPALLVGALVLTLSACEAGTPHGKDPAAVVLQPADVAGDLHRCPGSGPIDAYLKRLAGTDPPSAATFASGWRMLRKTGAVDGVMAVYAAHPADCDVEPGAGAGRTAATLVSRYRGAHAAAAAYGIGVMGFPTPSDRQEEPGLSQGVGTQLGPHAWTLTRAEGDRVLTVAYWQRGELTVYFVGVGLDSVETKRAQLAVDSRAA